MKNLIHLTEDRHTYRAQKKNDFIQCLVPNPNFSGDDAVHDAYAGDSDPSSGIPSHYILTPSGLLSAVTFSDKTIWTVEISSVIATEEEGEEGDDNDDEKDSSSWFHLWYDENSETLVALSHSGAIVSINPNNTIDGGSDGIELIGQFDNGISCAAWSADGEVLALVTSSFIEKEVGDFDGGKEQDEGEEGEGPLMKVPTLMTMNTQFEILGEENLFPISEKDNESTIHICWNQKYDNSLIAISCHDAEDNKRKVRIYKGDSLELVSMSRTEDGSGKLISNLLGNSAGSLMAWAGSNTSNLLACVQKKGKRGRNIVFLEPNGLQHGGFKIEQRAECEEIVGLNWNAESDILAVTFIGTKQKKEDSENAEVVTTRYGKIQLYHRSNYHWYLKYEIQYDEGVSISSVRFDQIKGYDLSIALRNQNGIGSHEWRHYNFIWDTSTTSPSSGMASVIDGCHLNLSMFQRAIVPPPMFSSRLSFESSIISVAHNTKQGSRIGFIVHLSDGTIAFCGMDGAPKSRNQRPKVFGECKLALLLSPFGLDPSCLRQLLIVNALDEDEGDSILVKLAAAVCPSSSSLTEDIIYFTIEVSKSNDTSQLLDVETIKLEGKLLRMVNWSASTDDKEEMKDSALLELTDGSLFEFSSSNGGEILPCQSDSMFLEPCPWLGGMKIAGGDRQVIIGLSSRYRLYCGERQLCDASSSFCLSPTTGFLSYVTLGSRSQLRFLPLEILSNFDPFMGSDDNMEILGDGYEPRNVERGSRLVSILPDKITTVLQLPRGNLEAVYPRALVLPRIMSFIEEGEYHLALDMMRRQKVDMNLIVDMEPNRFLEGQEGLLKMVKQVSKMDHLNLFIASLANMDFTLWKYPVPKWFRRRKIEGDPTDIDDPLQFDFSTKVNKVCEKMRAAMIELEGSNEESGGQFLLPILSTFAKQEPPKLEDALTLVKNDAMNKPPSSGTRSVLLSDKAQSSIQYLAFLADYKLLFDTALGMYDYELAKAVARNSQMDPKQYLPMLKRLNNLPQFEAQYEVDLRLSRYDKALVNLHKSGMRNIESEYDQTIDEEHFLKCKKFIQTHNLHKLGLELFINYPEWHGQIMISLGENLLNEQKADLALSIFLAAKPRHFEGAKKAARACGDWKTFFTCMVEEPDSSRQKIHDIAVMVADEVSSGRGGLQGRRDRKLAAARILIDYCQDIGGAIDMLVSAEQWFEARRLAILHEHSDLEKMIIDAAVNYIESILPNFEQYAEKFEKTNLRYSEVVWIRRQAKRDGEDPIVDDGNDETGSLFSLASNASNTSVRSNMSSSSVGSVSSISSVISAGSTSTFNLLNNDDTLRHKSKFNNIGKKKKKKKTRREKMRPKPGSEEELKSLIATMKENMIDDEHFQTIVETIKFLSQVGMIEFAKTLFDEYEIFRARIAASQRRRLEEMKQKAKEEERSARREGQFYEKIVLDCEANVDSFCCQELPGVVHTFFSYNI